MDDFRQLPEHALGRLGDLELMAYVNRAHRAGDAGAVRLAFELLHHRHRARVESMLGELPRERIDDVTQEVFLAVFDAAVAGKTIDKFPNWVARVTKNKQADFWRGSQGSQLKQERAGASLDDEDTWLQPSRDDEYEHARTAMVVDELLAGRSAEHQDIVRLYVLEGFSAKEAADKLRESEANVYKVAQRFRDDLRALVAGRDLHHSDDEPGSGRGDRI